MDVWFLALLSTLLVSIVSFVGIVILIISKNLVDKHIYFLVALSAGVLLGDAFFHLMPEALEQEGVKAISVSLDVISGFIFMLVFERLIHWHHCHGHEHDCENLKSFGYVNLAGDAIHNFIDGMLIAGSYLISVQVGVATTIAVILHEIPQELSDFGVLLAAGFSRFNAIVFNFISAIFAVLGAVFVLFYNNQVSNIDVFLAGFAAGGFIYIGATDLLPELSRRNKISLFYMSSFVIGLLLMYFLLFLE
jgi:zinc and cadmium transporter